MAWTPINLLKAAVVVLGFAMLQSPCTALTGDDYHCEKKTHTGFESGASNATAITTLPSVCYSPFHNKEYPLMSNIKLGDLEAAMNEDFSIMAKYFSTVRTYYASYYGIPVAPIAARHGIKLYLGVYMTEESWYADMVSAVVDAVKNYPATISAILVGNENISPAGSYSAADVKQRIIDMRTAIKTATGRTDVPVGTVQRSTEWLDKSIQTEMQDLAAVSSITGVNIYPFFDASFSASKPVDLLDGTWSAMVELYGQSKLRLTETGWPTAGNPVTIAPNNTPSLSNAKLYYDAFSQWQPSAGGGEAFWFMFFDRAPSDTTMSIPIEKYFGLYTWEKKAKMTSGFPNLVSTTTTTTTAAPTSTPVATTATPAATTATPAPTTATPVPTTATPTPTTATPTPSTTTPSPTTPTPTASTSAPSATTPTPTASTTAPSATTATPVASTSTPRATTPTPLATTTPTPTTATLTPSPTTPSAETPTPSATVQRCNAHS
jgi:exo-beta-1,3-glucanase (GH17 family)